MRSESAGAERRARDEPHDRPEAHRRKGAYEVQARDARFEARAEHRHALARAQLRAQLASQQRVTIGADLEARPEHDPVDLAPRPVVQLEPHAVAGSHSGDDGAP
jgi:hypothetical protein